MKQSSLISLGQDSPDFNYLTAKQEFTAINRRGVRENNFRNEIIWCYQSAGYPKNDFARKHDTIFRYSKMSNYVFNLDIIREEYAEATKRLNPLGKQPGDWWQIQPIISTAKERLGYPTQKPEALLERIIKASSNKGNVVLDPFCGSGTTLAAAWKLNRNYIGIDNNEEAIRISRNRHQLRQLKL